MQADVTASISTKDRYDILHSCLLSVANQTVHPKELIIFDDGEHRDLRQDGIYNNIFRLFEEKGIVWKVVFGERRGQVLNHQKALEMANTEWIWRIDDDNYAESNVLEKLLNVASVDPRIGGVASSVRHAGQDFSSKVVSPFIKDCLFKYAVQFSSNNEITEVEHFYSTFIYKKEAAKHGYPLNLSPVGHREETIFSHEIYRAGWKLIVNGEAITWHLHSPKGGIRSYNNGDLWSSDEVKFQQKLQDWDVKLNDYKLCYLNNGLGDHYVFKSILPEIRAKYPNHKLFIACCYPEVFLDEPNVEIGSLTEGMILARGDIDKHDVYKFCFDNNWKNNIKDAFRKVFV